MTIKSFINRVIGRVEILFSNSWLNIFATIYLNFRVLPLHQAVRFPILVYGRIVFRCLTGSVDIKSEISTGMIKFGTCKSRFFSPDGVTKIFLSGKMTFSGKAVLGSGCSIFVNKGANFEIGNSCYFNENNTYFVMEKITIGDFTRMGYNSIMMDTSSHFVIDTNNGTVKKRNLPIQIGQKNWIGIGSVIFQGTVTPSNTIVASRSLLNKDYTKSVPENSMVGGAPAKLIRENVKRIFDFDTENELQEYFDKNRDKKDFILSPDIDINAFCGTWEF